MRSASVLILVLALVMAGIISSEVKQTQLTSLKSKVCSKTPANKSSKAPAKKEEPKPVLPCATWERNFSKIKVLIEKCVNCQPAKIERIIKDGQRSVDGAIRGHCPKPTQKDVDALSEKFLKPILLGPKVIPTDAQIRIAFNFFDANQNGKISLEEAKRGSKKLGIAFTKEDEKEFKEKGDKDGDGGLSFEEFKQALLNSIK